MHIKDLNAVVQLAQSLADLEHTRKHLNESDELHIELFRKRLPADIAQEIVPVIDQAFVERIRAHRQKMSKLGVVFG